MSSNGTSNGGAQNGPIPNGTASTAAAAGAQMPASAAAAAAASTSVTAAPGPPIADFMTQLEGLYSLDKYWRNFHCFTILNCKSRGRLHDVLVKMPISDYSPTIPDAVTQHFLSTAGFETSDPRIVKLVSLASQKFVSDIANDALQHCKMRNAGQSASSKKGKDRKHTMTTEDLSQALSDQGITLKKPPYYV